MFINLWHFYFKSVFISWGLFLLTFISCYILFHLFLFFSFINVTFYLMTSPLILWCHFSWQLLSKVKPHPPLPHITLQPIWYLLLSVTKYQTEHCLWFGWGCRVSALGTEWSQTLYRGKWAINPFYHVATHPTVSRTQLSTLTFTLIAINY